jgi:hypothetical protein
MIDTITRAPLRVYSEGDAGPYIMVALDQLEAVRELLDRNRFRYSVDEEAISIDGKPEVTAINLGPGSDAARVQRILDQAS